LTPIELIVELPSQDALYVMRTEWKDWNAILRSLALQTCDQPRRLFCPSKKLAPPTWIQDRRRLGKWPF